MEEEKQVSQNIDQAPSSASEKTAETPEIEVDSIGTEGAQREEKKDSDETLHGVLAYIGILFLIPLLLKKENNFCQFHAKQGMVLFFVEILGYLTLPFFGLGVLIHLAAFVLSIIGIVNVVRNEKKELPIIGDIVKKLNL